MSVIIEKLREVLFSVLPITLRVLLLHFTLTPIEPTMLARFLAGAALMIVGLTVFLFGVDVGITPIGNEMGASIVKTGNIKIVVIAGLLLGFFISIAEPDLHILAGQVDSVTAGLISKGSIVAVVSIGIAALLAVGLVRIVFNFPLYKLLTILYGVIFLLAVFTSPEFMAIAFDASGATTGALTVPFVLALAVGVTKLKKDSRASENDSFGLVAIISAGAIITVMLMSILKKTDKITGTLENAAVEATSVLGPFVQKLPVIAFEVLVALLPILILFLIFQKVSFKLAKALCA